jgi:hypothetical protein
LAKRGEEREQSKMIGRKIKEQEKNANENKKAREHKSASSLKKFLRIMRIYMTFVSSEHAIPASRILIV